MWQIRIGLEDGLAEEQVAVFADPCYNWIQMKEIREGFENGLSIDQAKAYAIPDMEWIDMAKMRIQMGQKKESPVLSISLSINEKLDAFEAGRKLASVTAKEDIEK